MGMKNLPSFADFKNVSLTPVKKARKKSYALKTKFFAIYSESPRKVRFFVTTFFG